MAQAMATRELLARLVGFDTVSHRSNLPLIDFVETYLASHGVVSARVPDETGAKASLFALLGPAAAGGVVLSGHTDVVPVEGQDWATDPFTLTERNGRLYGRGTCDMKGFLACALALVPEMLTADLKRPIVLAMSYDEEIGCEGAPPMIEAMQAALPPLGPVIVGEPTEMRVVTGHKAAWGFDARVRGHEVHSSLIHEGVSAVMTAARLVTFMSDAMAENARPAPAGAAAAYNPPYTTLHVGVIGGGTAHNITARDCYFTGEVRILPDEDRALWRARIEREAARLEREARAIHPDAAVRIETRHELPPCRPEPNGAAEALARSLTGDNGNHVVSYMTEAGQFQDAGLSAVICGPGSIAQAHQPNEFISVSELDAGETFVRSLIRQLSA